MAAGLVDEGARRAVADREEFQGLGQAIRSRCAAGPNSPATP
jgi:hypothetical protein